MNRSKLFKSKRGEDLLVDFWAILVFAIVVILFFMIFSNAKSEQENKISVMFEGKETDYMLQSFLRSPAIGIDSTKTVADIIIEDSVSGDYSNTERLFLQYYKRIEIFEDGRVNDIVLDINGKTDESMKIITQSGNNAFVEVLKIAYEETKGIILAVAPGSYGIGIHEDHRTYTSRTLLPSPAYGDRVEVSIVLSVWTIDT